MKSKSQGAKSNAGIYFIFNHVNGKYYVGSAINLHQRWRTHWYFLRHNKHNNSHLQSAWNKYGENNFEFAVMEIVNDTSKLYIEEQNWIDASNCCNTNIGYNIKSNAESSLGYKHTENARRKISERNIKLGIKPPSALGRKWSEEYRAIMKIRLTGIKKSSTINMRGKPKSEEHKRKLSDAKKGKPIHSEEHKKRVSQQFLGNQHNRKQNKWPHELGIKCKCQECMKKKAIYDKNRRERIAHEMLEISEAAPTVTIVEPKNKK